MKSDLIGTWGLVSSTITKKDTVIHTNNDGTTMIKIINNTHFSFLHHSLLKDSVTTDDRVFGAGGGRYQLKDKHYIEYLEYCSAPAYEGNTFEFDLQIIGDTLIQTGVEKLKDIGAGDENQLLVEKYIRIQ